MKMGFGSVRWFGLAAFAAVSVFASEITDLKPTFILVSVDGLRPADVDKSNTPALARFAKEGVQTAKGLIPVFPTLTFPNHYSIVTGVRPEKHGIVANRFRDAALGEFQVGKPEIDRTEWWGGEPLWNTVVKQGQKSATMFWPGSTAVIGGAKPTYVRAYDENVPNVERAEQILKWLDLPADDRPTFLTLYFEAVDQAAHKFGVKSPEHDEALKAVDRAVGSLLAGLKARGIVTAVNVAVVSDHGMIDWSKKKLIRADRLVKSTEAEVYGEGAVVGLFPAEGVDVAKLVAKLRKGKTPWQVYAKAQVPARFHYRDNPRIPPIVAIANEGAYIATREGPFPVGVHGYDPQSPSMRAFFAAQGPAFKRRTVVPSFESIHLYEMMAGLLGVTPAPNDGDARAVHPLLRTPLPLRQVAGESEANDAKK